MTSATITIVNLSGPALRESTHDGARFVGGVLGQSYAIQVENLTHGRILAVITVDGRNVLDASPGDHAGNGYVLGPKQTYRCDGWRTSDTSVAEFVFTDAASSYAAATLGDASQVGVIGVAVFAEDVWPSAIARAPRAVPAVVFSGATRGDGLQMKCGSPTRSAGTGFGADRSSPVTSTTFKRHGSPEIHVIRYDTIDALMAAGLMAYSPFATVQPFPASAPAYCPRPVGG